jgi:hypothetical protein
MVSNEDNMRKNPSRLIHMQCGPSHERSRARRARVDLVHLVYLVCLVQPNKPDRPNSPNEQERLPDFFSLLLKRAVWRGKEKLFSAAGLARTASENRLSLHCGSGLQIMRERI